MSGQPAPPQVVTIGETMAAFRAGGPLRLGGPAALSVAGAESNVAIGLARLGHRVRWVGRVGADELGELVLRTLRAEGVDVEHVAVDQAGHPTGLLVFELRLPPVTRVSYYRAGSAGAKLTADDVRSAVSAGVRLLHLTGITPALGPAAAEAVTAAAQIAREHHAQVSLDVNYRARLWDQRSARTALRSLLPLVDLVLASDDELPILSDAPGVAGVRSLLDSGIGEVVVKRGAAGAAAFTATAQHSLPARPVTAVDVVGAGDAFAAGYLSALLDGADLAARLQRAVGVAAFAVASTGDWEGLPTRADLALLDIDPGATVR